MFSDGGATYVSELPELTVRVPDDVFCVIAAIGLAHVDSSLEDTTNVKLEEGRTVSTC